MKSFCRVHDLNQYKYPASVQDGQQLFLKIFTDPHLEHFRLNVSVIFHLNFIWEMKTFKSAAFYSQTLKGVTHRNQPTSI